MDPVVSQLVRLALALLFASASYHKLRDTERFSAILADYRLLPAALARPAGWALVAVETGLTIGLLLPARFVPIPNPVALAAAALLGLYSLAITINLARGRREIDCGCGGDAGQTLGAGLLARNALLIAVALASALPVAPRAFSFLDAMTLGFGLMTLALFWQAAGKLLALPVRDRALPARSALVSHSPGRILP